jgi:hypothetical protein
VTRPAPPFTLAQLDALLESRLAAERPITASRAESMLSERLIVVPGTPPPVRRESASARIAAWLRDLIADMQPGDVLPAAAGIAAEHYVSAKTVRRVTDQLRAEGLIAMRGTGRGSRLVVLAPPRRKHRARACQEPRVAV